MLTVCAKRGREALRKVEWGVWVRGRTWEGDGGGVWEGVWGRMCVERRDVTGGLSPYLRRRVAFKGK